MQNVIRWALAHRLTLQMVVFISCPTLHDGLQEASLPSMEAILCNNIKVFRFDNEPVPSNTYLLINEEDKRCIVIDPGTKKQTNVRDYIQEQGLTLE